MNILKWLTHVDLVGVPAVSAHRGRSEAVTLPPTFGCHGGILEIDAMPDAEMMVDLSC